MYNIQRIFKKKERKIVSLDKFAISFIAKCPNRQVFVGFIRQKQILFGDDFF